MLLASIHAVRPPAGLRCVAQVSGSLPQTVATLIERRAQSVERLAGIGLNPPLADDVAQVLDRQRESITLLHMDFRPANILADRGRIVGVVDWANALLGDPALEIVRAAGYGAWNRGFAAGYGSDPLSDRPEPLALVYRLYTATMLALVFIAEAPDPACARIAIRRLQDIAGRLRL